MVSESSQIEHKALEIRGFCLLKPRPSGARTHTVTLSGTFLSCFHSKPDCEPFLHGVKRSSSLFVLLKSEQVAWDKQRTAWGLGEGEKTRCDSLRGKELLIPQWPRKGWEAFLCPEG